MTLIISAHVPTAIVISGDSRASIQVAVQQGANAQAQQQVVLSDSAEKVFVLYERYVAGTSGDGIINNLPIAHYVEDFQATHPCPPTVGQIATELLAYFRALNPALNTGFSIGGYDGNVPWVMTVNIANNTSVRANADAQGNLSYGMQMMGDYAVAQRLLSQPQFNPVFNLLNLQDAIDFSRHLIRSTIDQLRFEPRYPTVGGPIDTVTVTPKGVNFLVRKKLHGN